MTERDEEPRTLLEAIIRQQQLSWEEAARRVEQLAKEREGRIFALHPRHLRRLAKRERETTPHPATSRALQYAFGHPVVDLLAPYRFAGDLVVVSSEAAPDAAADPEREVPAGIPQAATLNMVGASRPLAVTMTPPSSLGGGNGLPCTIELIEQCAALTDSLRHLDYQLGSRAVYTGAVDHLNRMMSLADRVPSPLYRSFTLALADIAQICGWLAIDQQDYPTARRYCALALASAEEGGDRALHAYVLGVMSYIHLHADRGAEAMRLLDAAHTIAESGVGVHPAVRSWLWEATGEAHGLIGERAAGATALHRAEVLFDRVERTAVPGWLSFYNDACHAVRLRGRCLVRIGDVSSAIKVLEESRALLPNHFVREHSGTLIDLAAAHLSEPEPERTVEVADQALQLAVSTGSSRNQSRLRELLPGLAAYRTLPAVRDLSERLR
jgi:hypothetical protein